MPGVSHTGPTTQTTPRMGVVERPIGAAAARLRPTRRRTRSEPSNDQSNPTNARETDRTDQAKSRSWDSTTTHQKQISGPLIQVRF